MFRSVGQDDKQKHNLLPIITHSAKEIRALMNLGWGCLFAFLLPRLFRQHLLHCHRAPSPGFGDADLPTARHCAERNETGLPHPTLKRKRQGGGRAHNNNYH